MPDYSTSKIDAKVIGTRMAKILEYINENYQQSANLSSLSVIQSQQVEGLNYGRVKRMELKEVSKHGNKITVIYDTMLESNNLNLKKSNLIFRFVDGVSDDMATNDFVTNICRYIKE